MKRGEKSAEAVVAAVVGEGPNEKDSCEPSRLVGEGVRCRGNPGAWRWGAVKPC